MGKGSSTSSGVPKFRSGTIVPPTPSKASHRIAVTLKAGRDFVPGVENPTESTVLTVGYDGLPIPRQHMAVDQAKRVESSRESNTRTLSYGERDDTDVAARIYRDNKGRVERTTDTPDGPLPMAVKVQQVVAAPKGRTDASRARSEAGKADRAAQDVRVKAVLRRSGWDGTARITKQMRQCALDLLEHQDQVALYTADKG